jgi:hypothetical protein
MRQKLLIPILGFVWMAMSPFPSWAGDMRTGDLTITPLPQRSVQGKTADPSASPSKPAQGAPPETKNPDPESQTAPALRIQEGTNAEG